MLVNSSAVIPARRLSATSNSHCTALKLSDSPLRHSPITIRTLMKRFTRLNLGFSKRLENLEAEVAIFVGYYNYCWRTRTPEKSGQLRLPAALTAGVMRKL